MALFSRTPRDAAAIVSELAARLSALFPGRLRSLILYGSAARGEHVPGRSDINLLLVLDEVSPSTLEDLRGAFAAFRRDRVAAPVVVETGELRRQAAAFPVEFTVIRDGYRVLAGEDVVAGLRPAAADLRAALRHELHACVMRLRRGYVAFGGDGRALSAHLAAAEKAGRALLAASVRLAAGGAAARGDPLDSAGRALGVEIAVWRRAAACSAGEPLSDPDLRFLYGDFLEELERLCDRLDRRPARRRGVRRRR